MVRELPRLEVQLQLTYEDLLKYTNNFSDENYIGRFQFGKIYHGAQKLHTFAYRRVIVKIWDTSSSAIRDNELRLMREAILLQEDRVRLQPAVVKLLGFVLDGDHVAAMYDFNDVKPLNTVYCQLNQDDFNWVRRINVALWFARIVRFFHYKNRQVIHNIDAAHILLNEVYFPKLFEFGLMTGGGLFPKELDYETEAHCENSGGEHDDVFAFGILLSSMISKRVIRKDEALKSLVPHGTFEGESYCYFYACDGEEVSRLAMQCMHSSPDERPSMKQVVGRLQKLQIVQNHGDLFEYKPKPPNKEWRQREHLVVLP